MVLIEDLDASTAIHNAYNRDGQNKLPVTILTGYPGSGKTTLLNYILRERRDKKFAVIENEVREEGVDEAVLEDRIEVVYRDDCIRLDNGCGGCTIRTHLIKALGLIAHKYKSGVVMDGVVIELTGMADPAPIVQLILLVNCVSDLFYIDNVLALVDCKHILGHLSGSKNQNSSAETAAAQIALSCMVLLNKADLVDEPYLLEVEHHIKEINSSATIVRCQHSSVALSSVFNVAMFSLGRVLEEQHMMDKSVFKVGRACLQCCYEEEFFQPRIDKCVSNVVVRCTGALDLFAFHSFLEKLLDDAETARDILRVKAVLDIAGSSSKYVVQSVHKVRTTGFCGSWGRCRRENLMIFIGRGMKSRRVALKREFMSCIAKLLRFPIGTQVLVRVREKEEEGEDEGGCGDQHCHQDHGNLHGHEHHRDGQAHRLVWREGVVLSHWDEQNAYKVRLLNGVEAFVPQDDDCLIHSHEES